MWCQSSCWEGCHKQADLYMLGWALRHGRAADTCSCFQLLFLDAMRACPDAELCPARLDTIWQVPNSQVIFQWTITGPSLDHQTVRLCYQFHLPNRARDGTITCVMQSFLWLAWANKLVDIA